MTDEMQNSIGIMQGRVVPQTMERLQIFPERWEEEFRTARELGFDHIELLDDKENRLRDLLKTQKQEVFASVLNAGLQCTSLCADQLCRYSLLGNPVEFKERLKDFRLAPSECAMTLGIVLETAFRCAKKLGVWEL